MLLHWLTTEDQTGTTTSLYPTAEARDRAFAGWLANQLQPGDPDDDDVARRLRAGGDVDECYQQWAATSTGEAQAWGGQQEVHLPTPRLIVCCDGGLVQEHLSDLPVDLTVIDYDVDGADADSLAEIPQEDGTTESASCTSLGETVNPARVRQILTALGE